VFEVPVELERLTFSRSKLDPVFEESRGDPPPAPEVKMKKGRPRKKKVSFSPEVTDTSMEPSAPDLFSDLKTDPGVEADRAPPPVPQDPGEGFAFDLKQGPLIDDLPYEDLPLPPRGGRRRDEGGLSFEELFDAKKPTQILGRSKRELLTRLNEYRHLLPEELKKFKVRPSASESELEEALDECETIVSCSGVDQLLTEGVLLAVGTVESVSSHTTRFDISGTVAALKQNKEFYRLTKLIWVKHRVFSRCPPEAQLLILVTSTALVQRQANLRARTQAALNAPAF
jgi:hypothetical protein